jgi:ribonuclease HI
MKTISIYSVGSCDTATRLGTGESLLEYNGKTKYLYQQLQDTTANRCIIEGLIAGVRQLKEPCSVLLVTATKIGVKKAIRGKGVNADLMGRLIKDLRERECVFDFEVWEGRGDELRFKVVAGRSGPAKFFNQSASAQHRKA